VLLIFTRETAATPGRGVPTHGADGQGHIAFRVADGSLTEWCAHFAAMGVGIELQRRWDRGGESVYVRDPAGNSVELVTGAIWAR
jgi:catechol 2,3-dioxygenase-like lactoylglutathione lyase family enzyme